MTRQNPTTKPAIDVMPNSSKILLALRQAFRHASPDWPAARAAILAGAPVDAAIPSRADETPLFIATMTGNLTEVDWLLTHAADPNVVNPNNETAMVHAMRCGHTTIAILLLEHGADPLRPDANGYTAPEFFMARGRGDLVAALDSELARPAHAILRHRLLDQLTAEQRLAWLPRCCAAEAAMAPRAAWRRTP